MWRDRNIRNRSRNSGISLGALYTLSASHDAGHYQVAHNDTTIDICNLYGANQVPLEVSLGPVLPSRSTMTTLRLSS